MDINARFPVAPFMFATMSGISAICALRRTICIIFPLMVAHLILITAFMFAVPTMLGVIISYPLAPAMLCMICCKSTYAATIAIFGISHESMLFIRIRINDTAAFYRTYFPMLRPVKSVLIKLMFHMAACVAAHAAFIAFPIRYHGVRYVFINSIAMLAFMPMVYVIRNPITTKVMLMVAFVAAHAAHIEILSIIKTHVVWSFILTLVALLAFFPVVCITCPPHPFMLAFAFAFSQCSGLHKQQQYNEYCCQPTFFHLVLPPFSLEFWIMSIITPMQVFCKHFLLQTWCKFSFVNRAKYRYCTLRRKGGINRV